MNTEINFNPLDLTNKKILVTGASSGIGQATSIYLSKLGANLVVMGRNVDRLNTTLSKLAGNGHTKIVADFSEMEDMSELFGEVLSDGIKLDGLVHCAGISQVTPLNSLTKKKMLTEMDINYFSYIELVRQYAKKKHNNGGSIIGISSIAADRAEQCQTNYAASKAALDISSQSMAIELAKKRIRINTVLPGVIDTNILKSTSENGVDLELIQKTQLLGVGKPDDVASVVAFLISDMSRLITGRRLFVDGGRFL
ncbi:SDR family NAD(P)-dependent oxidoreductase [Lysinibacillus agricola]|uniref:SDR family NAD(P)-dependent oxidoreductase n=1 Tax=Lysinibacillus agricola TaxID=2590012 RepID=UPI003C1DB512